jgi:hypothetical protein
LVSECVGDVRVLLESILTKDSDPTILLEARLATLDLYILLLGEWDVVRVSLHASVDNQVGIQRDNYKCNCLLAGHETDELVAKSTINAARAYGLCGDHARKKEKLGRVAYIQERLYGDGFERHANYIQGCERIQVESDVIRSKLPRRAMLEKISLHSELPHTV